MPPHVVRLEEVPSVPLAVVRRQVTKKELARVVPECCGLVWRKIRAHQAKAGRNVVVYWDGSIRLEAGAELLGPFTGDGDVVRSATPAGTVAATAHFGPYQGLGAAHEAVLAWCKANRYRLAGPSWEVYGHWQSEWDQDPSRIRTDVHYRVVPA